MVGEVVGPTLARPKGEKRGRKSGPDLGVLIDTTVVGLFGLVAVATAHEHWLKERDDVIPITGPLKAWVDQLDSKTLKRIEKSLAPTLFVVGCATVIGPDIMVEMKERAKSRLANAVSTPVGGFRQPHAFTGRAVNPARGIGQQPSGGGDWYSSIPSADVVGSEIDA